MPYTLIYSYRSAVEGHFMHAFIHVPVVLLIGTTVVIFAFEKVRSLKVYVKNIHHNNIE